MMLELALVGSILVGLLPLLVPTLGLIPFIPGESRLSRTAPALLLSFASWTLDALLIAVLRLPIVVFPVLVLLTTVVLLVLARRRLHSIQDYVPLAYVLGIALLLIIPFVSFHAGLPTGDSQKAIVWAQDMLGQPGIPPYDTARLRLNRDPVDFYTPGLHALTASVMSISPRPLVSVGTAAIATVVAVIVIACALARELAPHVSPRLVVLSSGFLLLTQFRFLRYAREPGYHWQNLVGELFLFGLFLISVRLLKKWRWTEFLLGVALLVALAFSHQFTTFLAAFVLLPPAALVLWRTLQVRTVNTRIIVAVSVAILLVLVGGGAFLNLDEKIPHIFTADPHLLPLTPAFSDYPRLMGTLWLFTGLCGLLWLTRNRRHSEQLAFIGSTLVLLTLSQGPRLGIDIPPVRALLYSAVPLSITGGILVASFVESRTTYHRTIGLVLAVLLTVAGLDASYRAFTPAHAVRTNSTLTPTLLQHSHALAETPQGGVLVDDYNRRSTSWLVLSGKPMFTRIAADIARQAAEATQSPQRRALYLNQLQYEKVYALGSLPLVAELLEDLNVSHVVGVHGSSDAAFAHNPALKVFSTASDTTLYGVGKTSASPPCSVSDTHAPWLLHTNTLANDIGDPEDTFKHLQASVRSARISEPSHEHGCTVRIASAPRIPLSFNVDDYVLGLWGQDNDARFDAPIDFLITTPGYTEQLTIRTATGYTATVQSGSRVMLPAREVPLTDDGFVTIDIVNDSENAIPIDLIALGVAGIS